MFKAKQRLFSGPDENALLLYLQNIQDKKGDNSGRSPYSLTVPKYRPGEGLPNYMNLTAASKQEYSLGEKELSSEL